MYNIIYISFIAMSSSVYRTRDDEVTRRFDLLHDAILGTSVRQGKKQRIDVEKMDTSTEAVFQKFQNLFESGIPVQPQVIEVEDDGGCAALPYSCSLEFSFGELEKHVANLMPKGSEKRGNEFRALAVRLVFERLILLRSEKLEEANREEKALSRSPDSSYGLPRTEDGTIHGFSLPEAIEWVATFLATSKARLST